jgi:hypothetical protein
VKKSVPIIAGRQQQVRSLAPDPRRLYSLARAKHLRGNGLASFQAKEGPLLPGWSARQNRGRGGLALGLAPRGEAPGRFQDEHAARPAQDQAQIATGRSELRGRAQVAFRGQLVLIAAPGEQGRLSGRVARLGVHRFDAPVVRRTGRHDRPAEPPIFQELRKQG